MVAWRVLRKLLHKYFVRLVPWLVHFYVSILFKLVRVEVRVSERAAGIISGTGSVVLVFWHSRLLLMPHIVKNMYGRCGVAVTSSHKDGEYISNFLASYGHGAIRGSSHVGGAGALKGVLMALKRGQLLAITPDGPTGPKEVVKGSVASIALINNVPLLCACYSAARAIRLKTWDSFLLPLLFRQHIVIDISDPILSNIDGRNKNVNELLTDVMREQALKLDCEMGCYF